LAGLILVLNAGSSTLKASLVDPANEEPLASTNEAWTDDRAVTVRATIGSLIGAREITAVAHRVVHGGARFTDPVVIDDAVVGEIEALTELAPLHNAPAVEVIHAARSALPQIPHIACFDTSFHSKLPELAWRYPVPRGWADEWGIRRFGFHGLSVEWAVRKSGESNVVVAHLGSGCSVTAVSGGHSVWTSMGYTPLEGLMMGTRSGSIDPGIPIQLLRTNRLTMDELEHALERRSGLVGVSELTGDMRELRASAKRGNKAAALAIEMFIARAAEVIAGAFTWSAAETLVFTGGIGENDEATREEIVARLPFAPRVVVIEAREDLVMATSAERLIRAT
jgi:acetate kinase